MAKMKVSDIRYVGFLFLLICIFISSCSVVKKNGYYQSRKYRIHPKPFHETEKVSKSDKKSDTISFMKDIDQELDVLTAPTRISSSGESEVTLDWVGTENLSKRDFQGKARLNAGIDLLKTKSEQDDQSEDPIKRFMTLTGLGLLLLSISLIIAVITGNPLIILVVALIVWFILLGALTRLKADFQLMDFSLFEFKDWMLFGFAMLLGGILSIGLGVAVLILADFWWISILYFLGFIMLLVPLLIVILGLFSIGLEKREGKDRSKLKAHPFLIKSVLYFVLEWAILLLAVMLFDLFFGTGFSILAILLITLGFSIVGYCLVMLVISIKEIIPGESTYKGTAWAIILLFLQGLMGFLFASFYYFTQTI